MQNEYKHVMWTFSEEGYANRVAQLADYDENDFGSKYSIDMEEYEYLLNATVKEEEEEEMGRARPLKIQAVHRGRKSKV